MSRFFKSLFFLWIAAALTGCTSPTPPAPTAGPSNRIANPASENCINQGGTLLIQKRGDGGEYGVCLFEDNRQCEEWALMRGECPVGGLKITGYITEAAQYCIITGGSYSVTENSGTEQEQGICTFKDGRTCSAADYFAGTCDPNSAAESYGDPFTYCAAVGTIDAPDARYSGEKMPDIIVQSMIEMGIVTTDVPEEIKNNAIWRCMDNKVWVCLFGANLPCQEKADLSQTPTSAMEDYCKANPSSEFIPASVTGRATVYEWKCKDDKPEVNKQAFTVDARGFLADFWYELTSK